MDKKVPLRPVNLWPGPSNTGHTNAPGYPGSLTPWTGGLTISGGGSAGNPQVISLQDIDGGATGISITGAHITFVGCRFQGNKTTDKNVRVQAGAHDIIFSYCSFTPRTALVTTPPHAAWPSAGTGLQIHGFNTGYSINYGDGYQYGIDIKAGPVDVDHCDIWGFGNAIVWYSTTAPMTVTNSWIHDARDYNGGVDHTDGVGYLNGGKPPQNVTLRHNTIASIGNTNGVAFQAASSPYSYISIIDNYLSGFGKLADIVHNVSGSTHITVTDNVFATDLPWVFGPIYTNVATLMGQATNTWARNRLKVYPGTAPLQGSTPAWNSGQDGYFLLPNNTLSVSDF